MTPVIKRRLLLGGSVAAVLLLVAWQVHRANRIEANIANLQRGGPLAQDAAEDLAKMGRSARKAVPALIEVLMRVDGEDPGPSPKPQAASALVAIGPAAVSPLLEAFRHERNRERVWGTRPLADDMDRAPAAVARGSGEGVPPLFSALGEMRKRGDRESGKVEAALREHASHDCIHVRSWVRHALDAPVYRYFKGRGVAFAPSDREFGAIIDRLVENMHHDDALIRAWAAHALCDIARCSDRLDRRRARRVLPVLAKALRDDDVMVRYQSSHAVYHTLYHTLFRDGETPPPVVISSLVEALGDLDAYPSMWSRRHLFESIWLLGPRASAAVPVLGEILANEEHERIIRSDAAFALEKIGHAGGVAALMSALDDPNASICGSAAAALGEIGPEARAAVPGLLELLDDERVTGTRLGGEKITVASEAAEALRKIDPEAAEPTGMWEGEFQSSEPRNPNTKRP